MARRTVMEQIWRTAARQGGWTNLERRHIVGKNKMGPMTQLPDTGDSTGAILTTWRSLRDYLVKAMLKTKQMLIS